MKAGFYTQDATIPAPSSVVGLNALIQLGLIRMTGADASDQMTEIVGVLVRSNPSGELNPLTKDFNLLPNGNEDWNTESGSQDNGVGALNFVNHRLRLVATNDGETVFAETVPELVEYQARARFFSCSQSGIWHLVEFSAVEPGESFKIYTLELTVVNAGRFL